MKIAKSESVMLLRPISHMLQQSYPLSINWPSANYIEDQQKVINFRRNNVVEWILQKGNPSASNVVEIWECKDHCHPLLRNHGTNLHIFLVVPEAIVKSEPLDD